MSGNDAQQLQLLQSLIDRAREKLDSKAYLDAARLYEAAIILDPVRTAGIRPRVANAYYLLRDPPYRARAREHLEIYMQTVADPRADVVRFLILNIYLANGPREKAVETFAAWRHILPPDDVAALEARFRVESDYDGEISGRTGIKRTGAMPGNVDDFETPDVAFDQLLADNGPKPLLTDAKIFTFGSCFAGNVARTLQAEGFDVGSFWVGEEANTTFSNANLVTAILGEAVPHKNYYDRLLLHSDVDALRTGLLSADVLIYTLGLAPAFFDAENAYVPHSAGNYRALTKDAEVNYRFSTVEENLVSLNAILETVKRATRVKTFILTVSPVPLANSLGQQSAICADTESKAILRTAAGAFARQHPDDVIYFPSFEYFRWLPCFTQGRAFGDDDGSTRHPNDQMVKDIIQRFTALYR